LSVQVGSESANRLTLTGYDIANSTNSPVTRFEFADGGILTYEELLARGVAGSTLDDIIVGTAVADLIRANNGNDHVSGQAGNDTLIGGWGNDSLAGGWGSDLYSGGFKSQVQHPGQ